MAEKTFTKEQLSAIATRDKTLLVSAAAGSGKTAVLTERIIRTLLDEKSNIDINRMLIVTFTNAAVYEMRERITSAIKKKLEENPDNKKLEKQLYMLPSAKICTIDSFCNEIFRNNAERFGISPKYRIADGAEAKIISHSVMSALIESAVRGDISHVVESCDFERLADCLTAVKSSSNLEEVFDMLYEKSKSHELGVSVFSSLAESLKSYTDMNIEENPYCKYATNVARDLGLHYSAVFKKLMDDYGDFTDGKEPKGTFSKNLLYGYTRAENLLSANGYEEIRTAIEEKFPSYRFKTDDEEISTLAGNEFSSLREGFKSLWQRYFTYTKEEWKDAISRLCQEINTLAAFLSEFDKAYFEEKKSRGVLEYSDIERLASECLYENGEPGELAKYYREEFEAVYIDEFQDINEMQNKIFSAISRENNRFMVGDIKQSIYGFRNAKPEIFKNMKSSFPDIAFAENSPFASVFMSKNFRCDRGIVDFVNSVFDSAFELTKESIAYTADDRLVFGKISEGEEPPVRQVEIQLFSKKNVLLNTPCEKHGQASPISVALKIKKLLDGETLNSGKPIKKSDIAILMRKDNGRIEAYGEALRAVGISASYQKKSKLLHTPEIQLMLCLLNTLDNPRRDVYLAGLMLSPVFDFTPDEMLAVKNFEVEGCLWDEVRKYSEEHRDNEKLSSFVKTVTKYRSFVECMKTDALIARLYNDFHIPSLAKSQSGKENLLLLLNSAKSFESSSYSGLHSFINYINTLLLHGKDIESENEETDEDAVKIMTVHKSKGLEFPVVFLVDIHTPLISSIEKQSRIVYSDSMGIALRERMPDGLVLYDNPIFNVISDSNADKAKEEELRVYYVALTRARERLYMVGSPSAKEKNEYEDSMRALSYLPSRHTLKETKSLIDILFFTGAVKKAVLDWRLCRQASDVDSDEPADFNPEDLDSYAEFIKTAATLNRLPVGETLENYLGSERISQENESGDLLSFDSVSKSDTLKEDFTEELIKRLRFEYKNKHLTSLPEKMSVSNLYPTVLDDSDGEERLSIDTPSDNSYAKSSLGTLPRFMIGEGDYSQRLRGIATHNFLQFFDIPSLIEKGSEKELERLVRSKFISQKNASMVRVDELLLFEKSKLLLDMKNAKNLYREFRFSVMLPAVLFTSEPEKKKALEKEKLLLQGVIDCIIEDACGELHLVDYKTDRLTREELLDRSLAEKNLANRHSLQLGYYALAIEKIFLKKPKTVSVYSLVLGDTVEITL